MAPPASHAPSPPSQPEGRFHTLFQGSPLPMLTYDADSFAVLDVNEAAVRVYGYSRSEFAGMSVMDIRPDEEKPKFQALMETLPSGVSAARGWKHLRRDGTTFDVQVFVHVTDVDGRRTGISVVQEVTEERRLQAQRDQYAARLREVGRRLVSLQEQERRELASELHDRVGQTLSALGIRLALLEAMLAGREPEATGVTGQCISLLEETGQALRGVISELRPAALHDYGLAAALRGLGHQARRRYNLEVRVEAVDLTTRLPAEVEAALLRIAQEALANVAKHAEATSAHVVLSRRPQGATLCVADNGCGFDPAVLGDHDKLSRWGLMMMRERADAVGARLSFRARPGQGVRVIVSWRAPE